MNNDTRENKWNELKGRIRRNWALLTDDDVKDSNGSWDELANRLQKIYGVSKNQAQAEIERFKNLTH